MGESIFKKMKYYFDSILILKLDSNYNNGHIWHLAGINSVKFKFIEISLRDSESGWKGLKNVTT